MFTDLFSLLFHDKLVHSAFDLAVFPADGIAALPQTEIALGGVLVGLATGLCISV